MLPNKEGITQSKNIPLNLKVTQFLKNDILLSNIRPYFKKIWLAKFMGGCSADVLVFRTNSNYDPAYIKHCLSQDAFFAYDMAGSKGSKMPRGDKDHILNFKLLDLDIKEQQKIGRILSNIDEKIAVNNEINKLLEQSARAIYEYYFVQFDFPNANGKPYKSSGGEMIFNPTLNHHIPQSWEVCELGDICEMYQPQTLTTKQLIKNGKYLVYGANGIIGKHNEYNHAESEVVIACRGNCGTINRTLPKSWIIGNAMVIKPKNSVIHNEYIYHALHYINIKDIVTGSVQKQITKTNLVPTKILRPNLDIILKYCSIIKSNVELRLKNEVENQKLKALRDFLLPLLLNAQVKIK